MVNIFTDGQCYPNPGGAGCWAFVVYNQDGELIYQKWGGKPPEPTMTVNRAEQAAILHALQWAHKHGHKQLHIHSDSQIVIYQLTGVYQCYQPTLLANLQRMWAMMKEWDLQVEFHWVPREQNTQADAGTRKAYKEVTGREAPKSPPPRKKKR